MIYRWNTNSILDWKPCVEFYFVRGKEAWRWNNFDKKWQEAWHGVASWESQTKKGWSESSPLEFVLLTGHGYEEPT